MSGVLRGEGEDHFLELFSAELVFYLVWGERKTPVASRMVEGSSLGCQAVPEETNQALPRHGRKLSGGGTRAVKFVGRYVCMYVSHQSSLTYIVRPCMALKEQTRSRHVSLNGPPPLRFRRCRRTDTLSPRALAVCFRVFKRSRDKANARHPEVEQDGHLQSA